MMQTESVYSMVNARVVCVDCEQELFSDDWEPVMLEINGEKIHAAYCSECIHNVYTVRAERIAEELDLLAVLSDGTNVYARELCSVCGEEDCTDND